VIGTDTAFYSAPWRSWGQPPRPNYGVFLLTLTVVDDIAAVTIIGVVYS
jgi:Na+/H+ antiporter NhaA